MTGRAIGIVGAGAVAQAIGRLLYAAHEPVVAVAGRTDATVKQAAVFIGEGVEAVALSDLPRLAARVLIATSDSGVHDAADQLSRAGFGEGSALHTCGAKGPGALEPLRLAGVHCGVLHPLQTVVTPEQGVRDLQYISFGLAGDPEAVAWGREVIALLRGREIAVAPDRMASYHAGAVMASNAVNALLDTSVQLMGLAGVDYREALDGLGPLCRTSVENALRLGPQAALTGPVVRGDVETVRAHVAALAGASAHDRALYRSTGYVLLDLARRRGLPDDRLQELAAVLDGAGDVS